MTDNNRNASNQGLRYRTPQAEVIEVNVRSVLCQSPTVNDWENGSSSDDIDMGE